MTVHHLNCGTLHVPPNPQASCHCLLLECGGRLALIDTGIGLEDIARPLERIGPPAIAAAGFQFHEPVTAIRQIERLGYRAADVSDIVLTHADPDHAGGLADFPTAAVHISEEEAARLGGGYERYSPAQFAHGPRWVRHPASAMQWFGLESRPVALFGSATEVLLVPLFGHTLGHCGVAVRDGERWQLHVGDAYYLRAELATDDHPMSALAAMRADDDGQRRASLSELRRLVHNHAAEVALFGYHDFGEFPAGTNLERLVPLECKVQYSTRQHHGGYFVRVRYTLAAAGVGVEVEAPVGVATWTTPAAEWDRLIAWQFERLPVAWRDAEARPHTPGDEPWVAAIRRGVAERAAWWWTERQTAFAARLTLSEVRVHPTDTSPGICEQAGREMVDEVVQLLFSETT